MSELVGGGVGSRHAADCNRKLRLQSAAWREPTLSDSRCFVLSLAPDAPASTRLPCLAYVNVQLSTTVRNNTVFNNTVVSR